MAQKSTKVKKFVVLLIQMFLLSCNFAQFFIIIKSGFLDTGFGNLFVIFINSCLSVLQSFISWHQLLSTEAKTA
jgi:hypothetical protein